MDIQIHKLHVLGNKELMKIKNKGYDYCMDIFLIRKNRIMSVNSVT